MSESRNAVAALTKRLYLVSRAALEDSLRAFDLGSTQYQVLWHLAHDGPMAQRDLLIILQVEKPTLSGVVTALVRKGLVEQTPDPQDQRQRQLALTPAGQKLWQDLPDLAGPILSTAFDGIEEHDLATVVRVLRTATERLQTHLNKGAEP